MFSQSSIERFDDKPVIGKVDSQKVENMFNDLKRKSTVDVND